MTEGDAGRNEEARTGYWKQRIKKPKVRSRSENISGWGWMHICIFFIYILLLSERDKEAKERALTGTARGCARYVIYTSGNHAPERGLRTDAIPSQNKNIGIPILRVSNLKLE